MLGLLRLCVLLAALVEPCRSRLFRTPISLSNDNRPSIPFSRPFQLFPGSEFFFVGLNVTDGEIAWAPGTPEDQKSLKCFKLVLEFDLEALWQMDAEVVQGVCAPDAEPLWSLDLATVHKTGENTVKIDTGMMNTFEQMDPDDWLLEEMFTPFFVNCCPNISTVSLEADLILFQNLQGHISFNSAGEFALPWFYVVRFCSECFTSAC